MLVGLKAEELEGVPPGKDQLYVGLLVVIFEQLFVTAIGLIEAVKQKSEIGFIEAVGGFLTITVWTDEVTVPQVFPEIVTLIE